MKGRVFALAAIAALAAWLRFWPDGSIVPHRTFERHDEVHYLDLARRFLNGRFDVHYFINPTLYGYLLAAVTAAVGAARRLAGLEPGFDRFVARETVAPLVLPIAGRLISIAASVLSVVVIARLGRRLFTPTVGLLAALLLALDALSTERAPLCGNESLCVLLGLLAVERLAAMAADAAPGERPRRARRFLAGALLGLAAATKYSAGTLVLPFVVALGAGVVPALAGAAAGFALGSPMALLDFAGFVRGFSTQAGFLHEGYRERDLLVAERGFVTYLRGFPESHHGLALALALAAGVVASLALAVARRDRRHLLVLAASLPLYLFLGSGIFARDRFLLPAVPFLLLHAAWLVDRILALAAARLHLLQSLGDARRAAVGLALVALAATPTVRAMRQQLRSSYGRPEPRSSLLSEVRLSLSPDERVVETSLRQVDRLLLESDPWSRLELAPPPPELRAALYEDLRAEGLLPPGIPLRSFLERCATLEELKAALAAEKIGTIVAVVPAKLLVAATAPNRGALDPNLRDCAYWDELFEWLRSLPSRAVATSPNGLLAAAVLELAPPPR